MTNSIRTPRQGTTEHQRRIAKAVDNEAWQKFRVSLKGNSTADKLSELEVYLQTTDHTNATREYTGWLEDHDREDCDVCIRVDNYIKALSRGGQLFARESLVTALLCNFQLSIKRN
jgi:hypothetical protein